MITTIDDYSSSIAGLGSAMPCSPVDSLSDRTISTIETTVVDQSASSFVTRPATFAFTAFTLIEVCIAMTVGILILGVAVLGISGIQEENELRETAAQIEATTRDTLMKAIAEHRSIQLSLTSFGGTSTEIRRYGETKYRKPDREETWEFSPTGVCEPIDLRISSERGTIEMSFDPLTGCARKKNVSVNG